MSRIERKGQVQQPLPAERKSAKKALNSLDKKIEGQRRLIQMRFPSSNELLFKAKEMKHSSPKMGRLFKTF